MTSVEEAALGGGILGAFAGAMGVLGLVWYILVAVGEWKVFVKGGKPGWHSLIPVLRDYDLFDMCWNPTMGIVAGVGGLILGMTNGRSIEGFLSVLISAVGIVVLVLSVMMSIRLAKAFGKGTGFAVGLVLLQPVFLMLLGFGSAQYLGRQD